MVSQALATGAALGPARDGRLHDGHDDGAGALQAVGDSGEVKLDGAFGETVPLHPPHSSPGRQQRIS